MRLRWWQLGGLLIGLWFAMAVAAEPLLKITLSNDEWPPYLGENLPDHGFLSRLVKEAFARANVRVEYAFYPNNRALVLARSGSVTGSLGWAPSEERKKDLLYTQPVMYARMVFFERKKHPVGWNRLEDLHQIHVGVTTGNYYSDEFDRLVKAKAILIDEASSDELNLRKLLVGRIELFPVDYEVGNFLLAKEFSSGERSALSAQSKSFWSAPLHVVIWNRDPHAQELVERFNRGLKALHDSGDYDRIISETRTRIIQQALQGH
jgi:polar amino acid transport system substrate-binding protein